MADSILEERARRYGELAGIEIQFQRSLGSGTDGAVWKTDRGSAVKAFERQPNYRLEVECYKRLTAAGVSEINGFAVPRLISWDDDLWVIEIEIVTRPFILDFAKVYLDHPPDYSPEVLAEDEEKNREIFEDRWPQVKSLLCELRRFGIWYMDPKPGNIMFEDWPERG
jgi:hypothetical protein